MRERNHVDQGARSTTGLVGSRQVASNAGRAAGEASGLLLLRGLAVAAAIAHFALVARAGELRWDYCLLDGLLVAALAHRWPAERLAGAVIPVWLTLVLYLDLQRALFFLRGAIHTGDLFALDAALFPSPTGAPWPAWLSASPITFLDVLCGLTYAGYVVPFFAAWLWYIRAEPERARSMAWAFFAVNVISISCFLLFPAAPPWYVLDYGMGPADPTVLPSPAGAARLEMMLGVTWLSDFYSRNPNVFASTPSLHMAYALMATWHLWKRGWLARVFGIAFSLSMALSALYLSHHYVIDLIGGLIAGILACVIGKRIASWLHRRAPGIDG